MSFEEKKAFLISVIKFYRNRGYTLRDNINTVLKEAGLIPTKNTWEDTLRNISELPESDIFKSLVDNAISAFKEDIFKTILYRDKFISIYKNPDNFDRILAALENTSKLFDGDYSNIFDNASDLGVITTAINGNVIFTTKNIRPLSTKVDLGIHALKQDYFSDDYDKVFAYKTVDIPCFNSIIFNKQSKNIILVVDLANQFQDENLRTEIAKLVTLIRELAGIGHAISDTGINLFPAINNLYIEEYGAVKELAFKTDDGVSHREIAKAGIDDVRDGDYHTGGTASANIQPYDIKKIYSNLTPKLRQDIYLKGTWYALNLPSPILTNATISANSDHDFHAIITKLIDFSPVS